VGSPLLDPVSGWLGGQLGDAWWNLLRGSPDERLVRRSMADAVETVIGQVDAASRDEMRKGLALCFTRPPPAELGADPVGGLRAAVSGQVDMLRSMRATDGSDRMFFDVVRVEEEWLAAALTEAFEAALRQAVAATGPSELVRALDAERTWSSLSELRDLLLQLGQRRDLVPGGSPAPAPEGSGKPPQGSPSGHQATGDDDPGDLKDPIIWSVHLEPGGTLADLVVDADPPRVMVPSGTVHIITLEARTTRAVVLRAARPLVLSRRLPRPACLLVRVGAHIEPRRFTTDLDAYPPRLRAQGTDFPFSISSTDVEQFWFEPIADTHEIFWQLEVDWTCAGRDGTTVINNNGRPFEVYPVAALFDGQEPSVLNSGCDLFHVKGCPALVLEESGLPASLWDFASPSSAPTYGTLDELSGGSPPGNNDYEESLEDLKRRTIDLGDALSDADPDVRASWPEYRRLAAQVRMLFHGMHFDSHQPEEFRTLIIRVLRYLFLSGQCQAGVTLGHKVSRDWRVKLGADHPDTLAVTNRLAGCLIGLRKYEEAQDIFSDLLPRCEQTLGEGHSLTLTIRNNFAIVVAALGELEAARSHLERALFWRRRMPGADSQVTLQTASSLAEVLRRLNDHQAARDIAENTLQRYRQTLGDRNTETLNAAKSLLIILRELGDEVAAQTLEDDLPPSS
jgi:hypothetical protein